MKVNIKRVIWHSWEAIYINDKLVYESIKSVPIEFVCEHIQKLIEDKGMPITKIDGERYNIREDAGDINFPNDFNDIPKDLFA